MKRKLFILMFFYFAGVTLHAQEKIYMPYFEIINIHSDYQYSITHILKTYIEIGNKTELVLPEKDTLLYHETKEQALNKAKSLNIEHVLLGELNRIGETVIVSATLYKTETGEEEWQTIQKAMNPDDLDPIMQKMAYSINNRNTKNNSQNDIYSVTNYDSKQLNKENANTFWGIEIGGGTTFLKSNNQTLAGFGLLYSGDLRNIIFDIKGSIYFSDITLYNINIQVYYPLLSKKFSPIIGAGLGFGSESQKIYTNQSNYSRYSGTGLTALAGGGLIFNRTSNINLRLYVNAFYSLYQVKSNNICGLLIGISVLY